MYDSSVGPLDVPSFSRWRSGRQKDASDAWALHFDEDQGWFALDKAIACGTLEAKTLLEARAMPGVRTVLSAIRENASSSITKLVKNGRLRFAYDPKTMSLAALRTIEGEVEAFLSIVDEQRQRWIGTWEVTAAGTLDWHER